MNLNTHSEQAQCCVISIFVANVNIYKYMYRKKKAECDKIVDIFNLFLLSHVSLCTAVYHLSTFASGEFFVTKPGACSL